MEAFADAALHLLGLLLTIGLGNTVIAAFTPAADVVERVSCGMSLHGFSFGEGVDAPDLPTAAAAIAARFRTRVLFPELRWWRWRGDCGSHDPHNEPDALGLGAGGGGGTASPRISAHVCEAVVVAGGAFPPALSAVPNEICEARPGTNLGVAVVMCLPSSCFTNDPWYESP